MAFELWSRAQAKWRGLLVYTLLQATTRFVTHYIQANTTSPGLKLYASLALLAITLFCLGNTWRLLTVDEDGDEAWPAIW